MRLESADGTVVVEVKHGSIRVDAATAGTVDLRTSFGDVKVGIAEGTAAELDVETDFGKVRQELSPAVSPPPIARSVAVRARTAQGNIRIRRAAAPARWRARSRR